MNVVHTHLLLEPKPSQSDILTTVGPFKSTLLPNGRVKIMELLVELSIISILMNGLYKEGEESYMDPPEGVVGAGGDQGVSWPH